MNNVSILVLYKYRSYLKNLILLILLQLFNAYDFITLNGMWKYKTCEIVFSLLATNMRNMQ